VRNRHDNGGDGSSTSDPAMASAHRLSSSVSSATVKPGQEPDRTHFQSAAASADLGETRRNNFGDASSTTDTALEHVGVLDVGKLSENGRHHLRR